ncbi:MAG: DUF998 domain-containing protein [Candidatus Heimdallarchaeota archaeon]|nr:DUF998 domain-containing protein [Candidatus Heimdallarchaeota archaeon]
MQKLNNFLTDLQVVKCCAIAAIIIWIGGVITALLIGQLDPVGPSYDPAGFNPAINYISDLGNQDLTPMPIIINWAMINTGLLLIPVSLHLRKFLIGDESKVLRKVLVNFSVVCMLIAMVGLVLTGVISEDVGEVWDKIFPIGYPWHDLVADFAFTFFMIAGVLISTQCILYHDILEEKIGVSNPKRIQIIYIINSWILIPISFYMFYTVPYLWYTDHFWTFLPWWQWAPVWEWLLMISISFWLTSACILTVKQINRDFLN